MGINSVNENILNTADKIFKNKAPPHISGKEIRTVS